MFASRSSPSSLVMPVVALVALSLLVSSAAEAAPPAPPEPETIPIGVDFVPYVGTSSAMPRARRTVSFNLVGGLSGGVDAFGLSGAFDLVLGDMRGLELAGAFSLIDGDLRGVDIAGALNVVTGDTTGLLLAPINVSGGAVKGAQIGAINIAGGEVHGLQLGAINVAPRATAGIGVINVYWDGWVEGDLAITETALMLAGVRHGSGALYNVYYAGTRLDHPSDLSFGLGIGGRWQLGHGLELSLDVTSITTAVGGRINRSRTQFGLRPQLAWRFIDHLAIWAGPTLNVLTTEDAETTQDLPGSAVRLTDKEDDQQVFLWPGFAAGIRIL